MDAEELAKLISELLEDSVNIDVAPKVGDGFARLLCDDEEGNNFAIQVTQLDADGDGAERGDFDGID